MTKFTPIRVATLLLMILSLTALVACESGSESKEDANAASDEDVPSTASDDSGKSEDEASDDDASGGTDADEATDATDEGAGISQAADEVDESFAYVLMKTSMGDMVIALNRKMAPISVDNFLKYVDEEYYDGTIFHRVISTFMIQGGGFTADMQKKTTNPPITNEWRNGLTNMRSTLAMARLGGQPDSATSQFFVNVVDNGRLDEPQRDGAAYAVFGRVLAGMEVVDAIRSVPTHTFQNRMRDVPVDTVTIESVRRISADEVAQYMESAG